MFKPILSFILMVLIVMMTACGTKDTLNNTDTKVIDTAAITEVKTEETILKPDVPDIKFDGYNFKILNVDPSTMHWATHTLTAEQQNGEVLNDSIYERNVRIEEILGIKFSDMQVTGATINSIIQKNVAADDDEYDAAMLMLSSQGNLAQQGYLVDWNEVPYINLDNPWWSQSTNSDISIMHKLFFAAGDIGLAYYDAVMPIIMNLNMVKDFNLDNPYELILSNKWTADKTRELMKMVTADLDGDNVFTKADRFGMFGMSEEYLALIAAFGEKVIKKDKDDIPYLAINTEMFQQAFEKAISTMNSDNIFLNYRLSKFGDTSGRTLVGVFTDGRSLFFSDVLFHLSAMRDMEDDFAILPRAKFDEDQEEYYSYLHQSAVLMCIPSNAKNLERTGIILESLAAESKYTVIKTYYDIVLSQKFARDEQSIKMLDILFKNRVIDLGSIFNWNEINSSIEKLCENSDTDIASLYAKKESAIEATIIKFTEFNTR